MSIACNREILFQAALKLWSVVPADACRRHCRIICKNQRLMSTTPVTSGQGGNDEIGFVEDVPESKMFSFLELVKVEKLNDMEKAIHQKHVEALKDRQEVYLDPATGYDVLTRLAHLRRGTCCGNACRHCPFGQSSVRDETAKKKYNSAFFV